MATFRYLPKWPSISERRSPTEQASNHCDFDRKYRPSNGTTGLQRFLIVLVLLLDATVSRTSTKALKLGFQNDRQRDFPAPIFLPNSKHFCVKSNRRQARAHAKPCQDSIRSESGYPLNSFRCKRAESPGHRQNRAHDLSVHSCAPKVAIR